MTTPKPSRFFNKTGQTGKNGSKDVCIMLPLKHLSTFWRTLKMPLINCEINLFQNWLENYFIMAGAFDSHVPIFAINDMKPYLAVVALSTNSNANYYSN